MQFCQVCGNDIESRVVVCPFCGSRQEYEEGQNRRASRSGFHQKTVNLEQGLPTVEQALHRLQQEITTARREQIRLLTLIHGYGSSGKGGAIRRECRKTLEYLLSCGEIKVVVYGEKFSRRQGLVKELLRRFPPLASHPHLNMQNRGITLVQLF